MFKKEQKVRILGENVNGVVKDVDYVENRFKVTYFSKQNPDKRLVNWFKAEQLKPIRNKDFLNFAKVRPTGVIPTKRNEDGCYDIYIDQEIERVVIHPNQIVQVPTAIATAFPAKYRFDFQRERGSTGSIGLVPRCGQVDSGYRGEIFLKLQNVTDTTIILSRDTEKPIVRVVNDKEYVEYPITKAVCQAALEFVPDVDEKEITYSELEKIPSERGKGKVGSSGK